MTQKTVHGIVKGRTIELTEDLGLPTGHAVEIVVSPLAANGAAWGEGLHRCAGGLADEWSESDDQILDAIYRERQQDRRSRFPA